MVAAIVLVTVSSLSQVFRVRGWRVAANDLSCRGVLVGQAPNTRLKNRGEARAAMAPAAWLFGGPTVGDSQANRHSQLSPEPWRCLLRDANRIA